MYAQFFPDPAFGWVFCVLLFTGLVVIAVRDLRTAKIPNLLSVGLLAAGVVITLVRGGWLASKDLRVWQLGTGSIPIGLIDAFLFSLTGFVVAFALYFAMWILGVCGGGDVKLMAAVGSWLGAWNALMLVPLTVVTLLIWAFLKIASGGWKKTIRQSQDSRKAIAKNKTGMANELPRGRLTFSMPALVAVMILVLWIYRVELGLEHRVDQPEMTHVSASHEDRI
jgi:prepilin peptidase CpaA